MAHTPPVKMCNNQNAKSILTLMTQVRGLMQRHGTGADLEGALGTLGRVRGLGCRLGVHLVDVSHGQLTHQLQQQIQELLFHCQIQLLLTAGCILFLTWTCHEETS